MRERPRVTWEEDSKTLTIYYRHLYLTLTHLRKEPATEDMGAICVILDTLIEVGGL